MALSIVYPHTLSDADARERLRALGDYLANKHGLSVRWEGDDRALVSGKYLVVTIEGSMRVEPGKVTFEGKDPGMLWRGKAKDYLTAKLRKYLEPSTPVAELPRR